MRKVILTILSIIIPLTALAGSGYTCYMPPPQLDGKPIAYIVYNGTGAQTAETEIRNAYARLIHMNTSFFSVHEPTMEIYRQLGDVASAYQHHSASTPWTTLVAIGDRSGARKLYNHLSEPIAFVPSAQSISASDLYSVESSTNMDYYTIAGDHAIRRATRMAFGLDAPNYSIISPDHIVADFMSGN